MAQPGEEEDVEGFLDSGGEEDVEGEVPPRERERAEEKASSPSKKKANCVGSLMPEAATLGGGRCWQLLLPFRWQLSAPRRFVPPLSNGGRPSWRQCCFP